MRKAKNAADRVMARHWALLRALPRAPRSATARELMQKLRYDTKRMVERDLKDLEEAFPGAIECDDSARPHGWRWAAGASILGLPAMNEGEALALKLVERFLLQHLPRSVTVQLEAQFREASRVLGELAPQPRRTWADKLHFESPTQPLLPPRIDPEVLREVLEALLRDHQLRIRYKDGEKGPKIINPLVLVQRGPVTYLVCNFEGYQDVRLLALHRMRSAEHVESPAIVPRGFKFKDYLASGALGFGNGEKITLEARFLGNAVIRIKETPLSTDQEILSEGEGEAHVRATVVDTPQLKWWICSLGETVEVLKPTGLRSAVSTRLSAAADVYERE